MKQSLQKNKLSKIPKSKKTKINFEFSLKAKNRFSRLKYDSINKETLDGSYVDTVFFKPDSLNNSNISVYFLFEISFQFQKKLAKFFKGKIF